MLIMRTARTFFDVIFHEALFALLFALAVECPDAIRNLTSSHFVAPNTCS